MILKYEICFDNHRMESGKQEEKWFHYSYLPELIPCDITFGNVQANEKKLNRRVITLVYLISRLFYIWFLAINLEPADLVNQTCFFIVSFSTFSLQNWNKNMITSTFY